VKETSKWNPVGIEISISTWKINGYIQFNSVQTKLVKEISKWNPDGIQKEISTQSTNGNFRLNSVQI
jgi:hypothetical protein